MKKIIENSYSTIFKGMLKAVNPIKKRIIKTECKVHQYINNQALTILKNDGYDYAYREMSLNIDKINEGVVWADQDFKSSNHFYNPQRSKGLYGCSNALKECSYYYARALTKFKKGDKDKAYFYLGAACHLIQDVTVPQHVNVKLLDSHRKYEQWIIKTYRHHDSFNAYDGGLYFKSIKEFIEFNANSSMRTYNKFKNELNEELRYYKITSVILKLAQRTTAGLMLKFFNDVRKLKNLSEE